MALLPRGRGQLWVLQRNWNAAGAPWWAWGWRPHRSSSALTAARGTATHPRRCADAAFLSFLGAVRTGQVEEGALRQFAAACARPLPPAPGAPKPIELFTCNRDANSKNARELAKLPGPARCGGGRFHGIIEGR